RLRRDQLVADYAKDLPSAVACLQDDFEACIAHLKFPLAHRRAIRTTDEMDKRFFVRGTNLLERLFGEERRRTKVIPHAFRERALLKLMYAALIRAAERWRAIKTTAFERRQPQAIRHELDRARAQRTAPATRPDFTASQPRLSSKDRT
ncbi:MAG: transposase, partial [Rhodospirillaceae bacterium]|nr:transposase [Rhodospirillaceae bacterium]